MRFSIITSTTSFGRGGGSCSFVNIQSAHSKLRLQGKDIKIHSKPIVHRNILVKGKKLGVLKLKRTTEKRLGHGSYFNEQRDVKFNVVSSYLPVHAEFEMTRIGILRRV